MQDKDGLVQLNEVTVHRAVREAAVLLLCQSNVEAAQGVKNQGEYVVHRGDSSILDYSTGKKYEATAADGDTCCHVNPGESKRVQLTFPVPQGRARSALTRIASARSRTW